MTTQEIRKAYLDSVEPKIKCAESFANDSLFDKLRAVCNNDSMGYPLFHPFSSDFVFKIGMEFPAFCELWSWLKYCWDDDGETSFVCATVEYGNSSISFTKKTITYKDVFIMQGEHDYLSEEEVSKMALKHDSSLPKSKLIEYVACRFYEEDIEFLHNLIPQYEKLGELGSSSGGLEQATLYFNERKRLIDLLEQHIKSSKYVFTSASK